MVASVAPSRPSGPDASRVPHAGRGAFTLIELLVVISIIALLMTLLMPALARVRQQARLGLCVSRLHSQGLAIHQYAAEQGDRLPPRSLLWTLDAEEPQPWLIDRFLAHYVDRPFGPVEGQPLFRPAGIWRCPDIGAADDGERTSHMAIVHYAANRYLFNSVIWDDINGEYGAFADVYPGWEATPEGTNWRMLARIPRASDIVALMDTTNFWFAPHLHRHTRESYGRSCEVAFTPGSTDFCTDNQGSHAELRVRPAAFVDGHAAALPSTEAYWLGPQGRFAPGGAAAQAQPLYLREVERFMWFIHPGDGADPRSGP